MKCYNNALNGKKNISNANVRFVKSVETIRFNQIIIFLKHY